MSRITRRRFLQYGAGAGAAALMPWAFRPAPASAAAGGKLAKYVEEVPLPGRGIVVATPSGAGEYAFAQKQIFRRLHPQLPPTPIWAYDDGSGLDGQAGSFGMAVVAERGTPLQIQFTNELPPEYPSWIPDDRRLMPTDDDTVRVMTHLHGGFVAAESDGNPAITPNGFVSGETQSVRYPNEQPATLMWFHDHGLGATRLNVFAGLAAAYILRDDETDTGAEPNPAGIPGGAYEIPLVIQDRQFNPDGTFLYPTNVADLDISWIGEYFGDVMLVNGKVWPYLEVEPRLYRFRILNGCNARILDLDIGGARFWQIGAEGGMWDRPVATKEVVLAPAERADLIVDFSGSAGQTLTMKNNPPRKPISTPAPPLAQVMQIRVGTTVTEPGPATIPASLPGTAAAIDGSDAGRRFLTLNEIGADTPGWYLNLNGDRFMDGPAATETPSVGSVEDWYWINLTADTHPMHTHLFTHQVVGRVPFDAAAYTAAARSAGIFDPASGVRGGFDPSPFFTGSMESADATERGFKDTTRANPGYVTIVRGRFDLPTGVSAPQTYVYHCHIVEHEDNDMMRPFTVMP